MNHLETNLQISCAKYMRLQYPNVFVTAFPAGFLFGGDKSKRIRTGKMMKDMGYEPGTPDMLICQLGIEKVSNNFSGFLYIKKNGLFIEFKIGKGKLSENQIQAIEQLQKAGYKVEVVRSFDEFKTIVDNYLK